MAPAPRPRGRIARFVAPVALVTLLAAVIVVVATAPKRAGQHPKATRAVHGSVRRLPPYWTVRPGDTLTGISAKTGVSVSQLEVYNADADPQSLIPGERLLLWPHPPAPRPKPLGPLYWTVRSGDSFGSIAAKTGINLATLEQLNPRLKPASLQPGDRVRLRARVAPQHPSASTTAVPTQRSKALLPS